LQNSTASILEEIKNKTILIKRERKFKYFEIIPKAS
jgi:hypothetical protein